MNERLYLIAHVAGLPLAIDAEQVQSVVDIGAIVAAPRAAAPVIGLAALRSRVVTVIDTVAALGLEGGPSAPRRAVITCLDGHYYALLVDTLDDVAPFDLQPLAHGVPLSGAWRAAGQGVVQRNGEPILAIDMTALIPGHGPSLQHAA